MQILALLLRRSPRLSVGKAERESSEKLASPAWSQRRWDIRPTHGDAQVSQCCVLRLRAEGCETDYITGKEPARRGTQPDPWAQGTSEHVRLGCQTDAEPVTHCWLITLSKREKGQGREVE